MSITALVLNVRPGSTSYDVAHILSARSELASDRSHGHGPSGVLRSYFNNLLRREPRLPVLLANGVAFLGYPVHRIFVMCSNKQVRWVAAQRRITRVAHDHPVWDWTVVKLVRQAVNLESAAAVLHAAIAVCLIVQLPSPDPTVSRGIGSGHFRPESRLEATSPTYGSAFFRAEPCGARFARVDSEPEVTSFAPSRELACHNDIIPLTRAHLS